MKALTHSRDSKCLHVAEPDFPDEIRTIPYCVGFYFTQQTRTKPENTKGTRRSPCPTTMLPDGAADVGSSPGAETGRALSWSSGRLGERTPHLAYASSQGAHCELPKTFLAAGVTVNFTDEGTKSSRDPASCPSQMCVFRRGVLIILHHGTCRHDSFYP